MRITALLGATCLALAATPSFAGFLGDLDPFEPDPAPYGYSAPARHYHHHHRRGVRGYAMVAPGVMKTPYGMFLYDDTLGEWNHWAD